MLETFQYKLPLYPQLTYDYNLYVCRQRYDILKYSTIVLISIWRERHLENPTRPVIPQEILRLLSIHLNEPGFI